MVQMNALVTLVKSDHKNECHADLTTSEFKSQHQQSPF